MASQVTLRTPGRVARLDLLKADQCACKPKCPVTKEVLLMCCVCFLGGMLPKMFPAEASNRTFSGLNDANRHSVYLFRIKKAHVKHSPLESLVPLFSHMLHLPMGGSVGQTYLERTQLSQDLKIETTIAWTKHCPICRPS